MEEGIRRYLEYKNESHKHGYVMKRLKAISRAEE